MTHQHPKQFVWTFNKVMIELNENVTHSFESYNDDNGYPIIKDVMPDWYKNNKGQLYLTSTIWDCDNQTWDYKWTDEFNRCVRQMNYKNELLNPIPLVFTKSNEYDPFADSDDESIDDEPSKFGYFGDWSETDDDE